MKKRRIIVVVQKKGGVGKSTLGFQVVTAIIESIACVIEVENDHDTSKVFAIKLLDSNKTIGILGLDDIIIENKVATLFIGIGDNSHHNKGYGFEALKLLLEYGFNSMNLYRIQLNV